MNTLLVVAAALINSKGEILLAERPAHKPMPHHYEFPGGKVELGETPEAALVRELHEELGITVEEAALQPFWFLSHTYEELNFHLMMPVWTLRTWSGEPRALEHASICWKHPRDMRELLLLEADFPLIDRLADFVDASA